MDARDRAAMMGNYYDSFSEKDMTVTVTLWDGDDEFEAVFPVVFEVCDLCDGKGSHVNPSIDSNGITGSEMDELGPEFYEDYTGGVYDVDCYSCKGRRVTPEINEDAIKYGSEELKNNYELLQEKWRDDASNAREREAEMRYGC